MGHGANVKCCSPMTPHILVPLQVRVRGHVHSHKHTSVTKKGIAFVCSHIPTAAAAFAVVTLCLLLP